MDVLTFTKSISNINLTDYVINYIDQNMILYSLLNGLNYSVSACTDDSACIVYDITGLSKSDMEAIKSLPSEQSVSAYGKLFCVQLHIQPNKLIIKMM